MFSLQLVINSCSLSLSIIAITLAFAAIVDAFSSRLSRESVAVLLAVLPAICACVAIWRPRRWILLGVALPISFGCVAKMMLIGDPYDPFYRSVIILICSLLGSLVSDAIVLAIIKWSSGSIGAQRSLRTIFKRLILTVLSVPASIVFPVAAVIILDLRPDVSRVIHYYLWWSFAPIGFMNAATAIYCLIPTGVFLVVLTHRIVWPALNRLIFPVADLIAEEPQGHGRDRKPWDSDWTRADGRDSGSHSKTVWVRSTRWSSGAFDRKLPGRAASRTWPL